MIIVAWFIKIEEIPDKIRKPNLALKVSHRVFKNYIAFFTLVKFYIFYYFISNYIIQRC